MFIRSWLAARKVPVVKTSSMLVMVRMSALCSAENDMLDLRLGTSFYTESRLQGARPLQGLCPRAYA